MSEYDRHRRAKDSWALGRFVVPLARWAELDACVRDLTATGEIWPVSILAAPADAKAIRELKTIDRSRLVLQAVESRVSSAAEVKGAASLARPGTELFVELDLAGDLDAMAAELKRAGAAAKIRTGGITEDAIPSARQIVAFLRACHKARIRFKATAGLHHAVRGDYRLTYENDPPMGVMFGYLNVAMAAALLWSGRGDEVLLAVLEERSRDAFAFTDTDASWQNERLTKKELDDARAAFFTGFGSCSFSEPLTEIGLVPT